MAKFRLPAMRYRANQTPKPQKPEKKKEEPAKKKDK